MGCSVYPWKGIVILLGILLGSLTPVCDAKKIPRWWLKVAEKQGPNVCVVEEIPGTNKEFWTECRYWLNRDICGIKTLTRFECCEGFDQLDDEDGCNLVKPMRNLLETAESLGATEWVKYIRQSGRQHDLESPGAYTLFVPTNDAFTTMKYSLREQLTAYEGNPSNPILLYHLVPSKLRSEDFTADLNVETMNSGHSLRINKYSNGMTTINCALLVRKDQEASNGIVHMIDGVLDPSHGMGSNVAEMILKDGRFEVLADMFEKSGYINVLRTMYGSVSIFAPSDEAFQKLPETRREKIINDREARLALLQNHIIPHVICESAITGEHKVRNVGGNKLTFNCDIDGAYVESTKLKSNFDLGQNGIVHMIDDVLLPDRAKTLVELAESRHLETFVDLVKKSGLEETLSHTGDYTFFVPDENAWLEAPPDTMAKARRDPEYAGLMLRYHGAYGRYLTKEITDNQAIMSLDEENPIRLLIWRRSMGIEDAKILEQNLEAQNGVIHIIDRVIFPSNQTISSVIRSIRGHSFTVFSDALRRANLVDSSLLNLEPGSDIFYTFFIPTDEAFYRMPRNEIVDMLSDNNSIMKLVKNHLAVKMYPEAAFEPGLTYTIQGMDNIFNIKKTKSGKLKVNGATVISSHNSVNGIIHVIDNFFGLKDEDLENAFNTGRTATTYRHSPAYGSRSFTSSSSLSSRSRTRSSSTEEKHGDVTHSDNYDRNFKSSLRPKGSNVYASSLQKKAQHVLPQSLHSSKKKPPSTKFRVSRKRTRRIYKKRKSHKNRKKNKPAHKSKKHVTQNAKKMKINRVHQSTVKPYPELKIDEYKPMEFVAKQHEFAPKINGTILPHPTTPFNQTKEVNLVWLGHPTSLNTAKSYIYKGEGWEIPYKEPGYINKNYRSHKFYNSSTNYPPYHQIPSNLNYNRGPVMQTHSKTYSYKYMSTVNNHNPTYDYNLNDNSSFHNENTFSDLSPGKKNFSYVGHHYGNDIVGRGSATLPFSAHRASYATRSSPHSAGYRKPYNGKYNDKIESSVKKYARSRAEYSVPHSNSNHTSTFTFPVERKHVPSFSNNGKDSLNIVADYAFTGNGDDFADGAEFLPMAHPPEEFITKRQAKFYRRSRRKKRHHKKRKANYRKNSRNSVHNPSVVSE